MKTKSAAEMIILQRVGVLKGLIAELKLCLSVTFVPFTKTGLTF